MHTMMRVLEQYFENSVSCKVMRGLHKSVENILITS